MLCLLVYDGVQHICCADLCMMVSNTYYVVLICVWWCPTHIMLCLLVYGGVQHILCCASLCMVVSNTYYVVLTCEWWCPTHIMLCFCFFFLRFLYAMLPVSLDCSFLIAPLVFYSVYLIKGSAKMALSIAIFNYCEPDLAEINSFTNHSVKMVQTCM